jgi:hypothetical protein
MPQELQQITEHGPWNLALTNPGTSTAAFTTDVWATAPQTVDKSGSGATDNIVVIRLENNLLELAIVGTGDDNSTCEAQITLASHIGQGDAVESPAAKLTATLGAKLTGSYRLVDTLALDAAYDSAKVQLSANVTDALSCLRLDPSGAQYAIIRGKLGANCTGWNVLYRTL